MHPRIMGSMGATARILTELPALDDRCLLSEGARVAKLSTDTLRQWGDAGRVTCHRIGRVRVFVRSELERIARERHA